MPSADPNATCWTVLAAAAGGDDQARGAFVRSYSAPIAAYLQHRWAGTPRRDDVADAQQEVFIECMKPGGALDRADPERGDFRALLYGVVRNVARRFEERAARQQRHQAAHTVDLDLLPEREAALTRVFDRAWAQAVMRESVGRHAVAARREAGAFRTRFRILRLRHERGLPVRDIAQRLGEANVDAVHNAYRRARREFRRILQEVVAEHTGARTEATLDAECRRLLALLQ